MATPTDLDVLLTRIQNLKESIEKTNNMWERLALSQLEAEVKWYDAEGGALPVQPVESNPSVQISPPEVVGVSGWWTAVPKGFGNNLPDWSKLIPDPAAGLDLSISRDNGCFIVRNKHETAQLWLNETAAVAKQYGTTTRLIKMAGYLLDGWKYLLPTTNLYAAGEIANVDNYALEPVVPFNDEEKRVWKEMFATYHMRGAALAGARSWVSRDLELYPTVKDSTQRVRIDPAKRLVCPTLSNHPQWILPALMETFNTPRYMRNAFSMALNLAHEIDTNRKARVPGYETVESMGGERTRAWYDEFEDGATKAIPRFK